MLGVGKSEHAQNQVADGAGLAGGMISVTFELVCGFCIRRFDDQSN